MVVHLIENEEDPETKDMYHMTIHNENIFEFGEEVKDDAHNHIKEFCGKSRQIKFK